MKRSGHAAILLVSVLVVVTGYFSDPGPVFSYLSTGLRETAFFAFLMLWETWWALVLGFTIAGAVQAWISRESIVSMLEGSGLKEISLGTFLGFLSSSCSFSAVATAKNFFGKGASASASLAAFMFASTNLVIEIGLVMLVLLGWKFAAVLSVMILASAVTVGFIVHYLFLGAGIMPSPGAAGIAERGIEMNYKAVLNGFFLAVFLVLYQLKE